METLNDIPTTVYDKKNTVYIVQFQEGNQVTHPKSEMSKKQIKSDKKILHLFSYTSSNSK